MVMTPFRSAGQTVGWEGPRNIPAPSLTFAKEMYSKLTEHKFTEDDLVAVIRYHRLLSLPVSQDEQESVGIMEECYLWCEKNMDDERMFVPSKTVSVKKADIGYHNYNLA